MPPLHCSWAFKSMKKSTLLVAEPKIFREEISWEHAPC